MAPGLLTLSGLAWPRLFLEQLVDLVRIHRFAGFQSLNELLDAEALEFPLGSGNSFGRLGFPLESLGLLLQLRDNFGLVGRWGGGECGGCEGGAKHSGGE